MLYEAARARVLIGLACRELGDEDTRGDGARRGSPHLHRSSVPRPTSPGSMRCPAPRPRRRRPGSPAARSRCCSWSRPARPTVQIADELVISEKTVARHMSNIFTKLGVSSRAAATAYAYEHGLA